jgi:glycosyltransferase involved in cell wall biosynthesis
MVDPLRVAICLPGLHRVVRGAEVAFESIATELARAGHDVTVIGSGTERAGAPYRFLRAGCVPRERFEKWPKLPIFRSDCAYEELTFIPSFIRKYDPSRYDVVVTCSYPFLNWAVQLKGLRKRPVHVYVTENGDWPLFPNGSEFAFFKCDGVVCTNPDYFDAHASRWNARLIPNGVDCSLFHPGPADRARFGLPEGKKVVLMVSALIPSKRVLEGISAVSDVPDAELVIAGDGALRDEVDALGRELLGARYRRLSVKRDDMPALYRSADAFLHMSIDEPSANAYIEAMATGLPIVTHDRRVTRWTIGPTGTFVDTRDRDAVARALSRVLSEPHDRKIASSDVPRRFGWNRIAAEYANFFHELLRRDIAAA